MASIAARDAIAEACFTAGYAAAGLRFGIDEKTSRAAWSDWAASREADVPQRAPGFLGLHEIEIAGAARVVVTDVEAMSVVDVLRGASAADVSAWLERPETESDRVHSVVAGFSPAILSAVRQAVPQARMMACPEHSEAHGVRMFLFALRAARRSLGPSRNVREHTRTFASSEDRLDERGREAMGAWDDSVLLLYEAKERFCAALRTGSPSEAAAVLDQAREQCLQIPGAAAPAAFIETWGRMAAEGVGEPHLAAFADILGRMAALWLARRPPLPFDLARGLAILRDGPRAVAVDPETGENDQQGSPGGAGVPMEHIAALLSSPAKEN